MGRPLGHITAGIRLLSLGVALLPHIPDRAIAHLGGRDLQPSHEVAQEQYVRAPPVQKDGRAASGETELRQFEDVARSESIDAVLSGLENGGAPSVNNYFISHLCSVYNVRILFS